ncbi:hypothetical protein ACWDRR_24810 [Kitasatospora sp. NPDC003701]
MPESRTQHLTVTPDGFAAGVGRRPDAPFGDGVDGLHDRMFTARLDRAEGRRGIDVDRGERGARNTGATVLGREVFGPQRGPLPDGAWRGRWGEDPTFQHHVFVRTHHLQSDLPTAGGTTSHCTDGPIGTVRRACEAACGRDISLGGGAACGRETASAAVRPPCGSSCGPAWWTNRTRPSSRCRPAASACSTTRDTGPTGTGAPTVAHPTRRVRPVPGSARPVRVPGAGGTGHSPAGVAAGRFSRRR